MRAPDLPERMLLRPEEVAEYFAVSGSTVYRWIDEGDLEATLIRGTTLRVFRESVIALTAEGRGLAAQGSVKPAPGSPGRRRVISKGVR